ncbi:MAG: GNAT family N-acetyltransferase [Candidatus Eisenbacteria bacterium]
MTDGTRHNEKRRIVRLGVGDYEALLKLWQECGLTSLRPQGRDSPRAFAKQLECGQIVLGLAADGELIASVIVTHDCRKGWINRLVVHPARRRRGLGKALIEEAEKVLCERGFKVVAALIEDWNESSLSLFQSRGYSKHEDILYLSKRGDPDA